ncbi:MAG: AcvB/VirJ family lysyl-phosphatidylglycerol hydrolase [Amaricoccus sp.]|uniref:AcvB/VirJ family lysyl-phosphatidylglycerol hydrolase n=1 Tax=Amaricoccus sp. TaxID=1872485 RepID=UPI0039E3E2AF
MSRDGLGASLRAGSLALPFILALAAAAHADDAPTFDTGQIPDPVILLPDGAALGSVMLFSSEDGWGSEDDALAARLQAEGAAVVGIDLPSYLAALDAEGKDCVYLVADFESLGHQLERATGSTTFHAPIVAGTGQGGALAINILAQTPFDTLGAAIAGDPSDGVPLTTQFCTKQPRNEGSDGWTYALPAGNQPAPLTVVLGQGATGESAGRVADLSAAGVTFQVDGADDSSSPAFGDAVAAAVARNAGTSDAPAIVELGTTPTQGVMAIVLSGDGGWRDLDKQIAGVLQSKGVPTVGLDTLRWFWSPRTPQETGAELARLIDLYTDKWKVPKVMLVGYSFGADVLPDAYLAIPPEAQAKVGQISLLGLADVADWQITVSGWLGKASSTAKPTGPALAKLPPDLVQCIHGEEEDDSACPSLQGTGVEIITTKGGHHFDGNYQALAQKIIDGFQRRQQPAAPASAPDPAPATAPATGTP